MEFMFGLIANTIISYRSMMRLTCEYLWKVIDMYIAVAVHKKNPNLIIRQKYIDFDDMLEFYNHLGSDYEITTLFDDTEEFKEIL